MAGRPNYRTAPLKAISRHMIVEVCRRLLVFGDLRDYVYVGLGGLEFVDFELFHQTLGVGTMYSIEANEHKTRLEFNKPYRKIKILHGRSSDVLTDVSELDSARSIVWLDYTDSLTQFVLGDIAYVASKMTSGSALFVTMNCHFGDSWTLELVESNLGDYFDSSLSKGRYLGAGLGEQQLIACEKAIKKALDFRVGDFNFERALDIRYKDSARMQVAGWIIADDEHKETRNLCRLSELDFTSPARGDNALTLSWPELTGLEWDDLARQLPVQAPTELEAPHESISQETLDKFAAIYRFSRLEKLYA
jgi:hypothetical protein